MVTKRHLPHLCQALQKLCSPEKVLLYHKITKLPDMIQKGRMRTTTEAPLRWNPFFQQLADPKTALQPLREMHLPCSRTKSAVAEGDPLPSNFNVVGSSRKKASTHIRKAHPHAQH